VGGPLSGGYASEIKSDLYKGRKGQVGSDGQWTYGD